MKRVCGVAFLLGSLWIFPFPNLIVAPGYGHLPNLRLPSVREAITELPAPWNARVIRVITRTESFYYEVSETAVFFAACLRSAGRKGIRYLYGSFVAG